MPKSGFQWAALGCLAGIAVPLIAVILFVMVSVVTVSNASAGSHGTITKEQWKDKVAALPQEQVSNLGRWAEARDEGPRDVVTYDKEALLNSVGPPDRTQTEGFEKYLYWNCSDGTIQIFCWSDAYDNYGVVRGQINDY